MKNHVLEVIDINGSLSPKSYIVHVTEDTRENGIFWPKGHHMTRDLDKATRFTEEEATKLRGICVGDLGVKMMKLESESESVPAPLQVTTLRRLITELGHKMATTGGTKFDDKELIAILNPLLALSDQTRLRRVQDLDIQDDRVDFIYPDVLTSMDYDSVWLPNEVIDAVDPIAAVKIHRLDAKRKQVEAELAEARETVRRLEIKQRRLNMPDPEAQGVPDGNA